jgi:signal transduction histidine kinase
MGVFQDARSVRVPTSPDTQQPMLSRWPFVVLTGALLVYNSLFFAVSAGYGLLALPVAALLAWPVLWAWHRPVAAWGAMVAATILPTCLGLVLAGPLLPQPWYLNQVPAQLPVMYVLALSATRRVTAAAYAVTLCAGIGVAALLPAEPARTVTGVLIWGMLLAVVTLAGQARRTRRLHTLRIAEELGHRRLLEERARIARELHDVVAHHMSVIAVQAASAPYRVKGGMSEEVSREFSAINASARESLQDMRLLLGALRGSEDERRPADPAGRRAPAPQTAPTPGLGDLGKLAESVRRAGVPVRLMLPDPVLQLSPVQSLTVYRIVQEALSNVVRHAPSAETTVAVRADGDVVRVEVDNEHPGQAPSAKRMGAGLGLIGMRERVAALGGRLTAAPTKRGGFAVHAELPKGDDR